jgi:hypothetical protein
MSWRSTPWPGLGAAETTDRAVAVLDEALKVATSARPRRAPGASEPLSPARAADPALTDVVSAFRRTVRSPAKAGHYV